VDQLSPQDLEPKGEQLQQFRKDLTSLTCGHIEIPQEVDQAVLRKATTALARTEGTRFTYGKPIAWLAAAASLTLVIWISGLFRSSTTAPLQATVASTPGDLDRNGRVDILDAFQLARELDDDIAPTAGDINADGVIDRADVEAIAMKAVTLEQGAS